MDNTQKKSVGPMVGLIIVLVIIVVGGLYFWSSRTGFAPEAGDLNYSDQKGTSPGEIRLQGSSDELSAIEADLGAFNAEDIDKISSELE